MNTILCLGSATGPRVETVLDAILNVGIPVACSDIYADRAPGLDGCVVNCVVIVRGAAKEASLKAVEDAFGRVRDSERNIPVSLDIDVIGWIDGTALQWNAKYDPGRAHLVHGLSQLPSIPVANAVRAIAEERDFDVTRNAIGFYPLVSATYVERTLNVNV